MSFIDELHDVVDPWITCHAYQAWALWLSGRPAAARMMIDRALALSQELQHPFTRALTLSFDAWLCQWVGDVDGVRERARDALAIAREQGFEFWIGWDEMMLGWASAAAGDTDAGLEMMRRGLDAWRAVGSELGTTYFLALMAEAQIDAGRFDEASRSLDAADEVAERTREGWWAPEVHRYKGRYYLFVTLRAATTLAEFRPNGDAVRLLDAELAAFAGAEIGDDAYVRRARSLLASVA